MKRKIAWAILIITLFLQGLTGTAWALQVHDVAGEFICNCGCNKLLSHCEMPCGDYLRGVIKDKIRTGFGKEQIVQYMKVNFKEALLAAPEKKGFNLTAYITPFAVVFAGAVLVYQMLGGWVAKRQGIGGEGEEPASAEPKIDKQYGDRIEKELKDFGW